MNPQEDMTGTMEVPEKDKLDEDSLARWMRMSKALPARSA